MECQVFLLKSDLENKTVIKKTVFWMALSVSQYHFKLRLRLTEKESDKPWIYFSTGIYQCIWL